MPRKSKGTGRRRGGGGARGGKRNGNQKKTTTGFSIRRNGGPLNLSEWSNSSSSAVGSRRGGGSTKQASPTKRKRGTVQVPRPYAKARPQNADIEFQPSVLEFKPFVAADDPAAAVAELQVELKVQSCSLLPNIKSMHRARIKCRCWHTPVCAATLPQLTLAMCVLL